MGTLALTESMGRSVDSLRIRRATYDDQDAAKLIDQLQQTYVARYGHFDQSPVEPGEFVEPEGLFLVGYANGDPVACGGWRRHHEPGGEGAVELKRMYVVPQARGGGLSRVLLAELERTAIEAGYRRMVLETGIHQPEAIALYRSCGYRPSESFGYYAGDSLSRFFAKMLT